MSFFVYVEERMNLFVCMNWVLTLIRLFVDFCKPKHYFTQEQDCITQQTSSQHCNQSTVEGFWVVEQQSLYVTQCIIIIKYVKDFGACVLRILVQNETELQLFYLFAWLKQ